jgi:hypothetical protein
MALPIQNFDQLTQPSYVKDDIYSVLKRKAEERLLMSNEAEQYIKYFLNSMVDKECFRIENSVIKQDTLLSFHGMLDFSGLFYDIYLYFKSNPRAALLLARIRMNYNQVNFFYPVFKDYREAEMFLRNNVVKDIIE